MRKVFGFILGLTGMALVFSVLFPVFTYELGSVGAQRPEFLSPIPSRMMGVDLTKASNWFDGSEHRTGFSKAVSYYNLTISKLHIEDAVVSLGGEDLADSLIQYPGTALPGRTGNTVVFGHSALPLFFNPHEYLTIFSTLPNLRKGDEVKITYDGISYTYRVFTTYEVSPTDLSPLSQDSDIANLSLVTCVPPGDPRSPRRLVVKASLVPTQIYDNTRV